MTEKQDSMEDSMESWEILFKDLLSDILNISDYSVEKQKNLYTFDGETLTINIPGYSKDDVKVVSKDGVFNIIGSSKEWGDFKYSYIIPDNTENISVSIKNGVFKAVFCKKTSDVKIIME